MADESCAPCTPVKIKVPMTPTLERLLNPDLFRRDEPLFTGTLSPPQGGDKVYNLTPDEINAILKRRGAVVDLHPGMGGVSPDKLREEIRAGHLLTSLDYMLTRGCNFECTWCFASSSPLQKDIIPYGILEKLTADAVDIGTSLFILTGGEPLMYHDPALGRQQGRGDHFFRVVDMIRRTAAAAGREVKILTFDDVALITPEIARRFADYKVGLCTKGDTLIAELQDYKVNQVGAFDKMTRGYQNLIDAGYGKDPALRLVVNSVLDHTTFDGMVDLHSWVMDHGFDHSIVPVHYCGNAVNEDQEGGIHSPHVKVLLDLIARVDADRYGIVWKPWSAFTYDKTCNRNLSGLHVRADGNVTACSESPGPDETDRYTFGNVTTPGFSLKDLVASERLRQYRDEFAHGYGTYVCNPDVCDLNANDLCRGGCATRSAYSKIDPETGLIVQNTNPHNYSEHREDPFCPAWTVLAERQGVLRPGVLQEIHERLLAKSTSLQPVDFPYQGAAQIA